jgi:hypothetical protein
MRTLAVVAMLGACVVAGPARAAEQTITLDGEVPEGGLDHFYLPFDVPDGIVEIEVRHDDLSKDNILDWGLYDPSGFRGWGGGNEEAAIVGVAAASRSYLPGPIAKGTWRVEVGKAKIKRKPAKYHVEVILRDAATLPPQPERKPYAPAAALVTGARWYAGDFHVHSRESGDARPPLDEIGAFARSRGLDFVEVSDHNVMTHLDFFAAAQARFPELLFVPGVEFTTYYGHANGIGATAWVPFAIGQRGVTIQAAAARFADQGALFAVNHPKFALGDLCIGCAWEHDLDWKAVTVVEIATTGADQAGKIFGADTLSYWDGLCAQGHHLAAIGGSDDHRAGVDLGAFQSPIGDPTTMVFAEALSVAAILDGIRNGRTVVLTGGPSDPMLTLETTTPADGDTVRSAGPVTLRATVTGAKAGASVRLVHDGTALAEVSVAGDPFVHEHALQPPITGQSRVRAEVLLDGTPRVITSHLWLEGGAPSGAEPGGREEGCGCRLAPRERSPAIAPAALALALALGRRRARRR